MSRKRHTPADEPFFLIRALAADHADGAALASHTHAWGQLIFAAAGLMTVTTGNGAWVTPPHWAVWAPAGVAHAIRFTGAASLRTLYLRPGRWELPRASTVVAVSPLLRELIVRAVDLGMLDAREPVHVALAELIVSELRTRPAASLDLPLPQSTRLKRIAEAASLSPAPCAALARAHGLSARTLERSFLAETGLSFGQWRRQARFLNAMRALGAGVSVKQAAAEARYQSPSAFIAAFKETFGQTPGRYFS